MTNIPIVHHAYAALQQQGVCLYIFSGLASFPGLDCLPVFDHFQYANMERKGLVELGTYSDIG